MVLVLVKIVVVLVNVAVTLLKVVVMVLLKVLGDEPTYREKGNETDKHEKEFF